MYVFYVGNPDFANIDWSKVSAHELGHAFGYNGHYGGGDVMHIYYHGIIDSTPASNELDHLGQVY